MNQLNYNVFPKPIYKNTLLFDQSLIQKIPNDYGCWVGRMIKHCFSQTVQLWIIFI